MVSVCPGGQILLTCEHVTISGSFLYWTISAPHLAIPRERIVANQGPLSTDAQFNFSISFTQFNVTRTSVSPLISQLLIDNVTTEINGSTIYCSEDGNENNAPSLRIAINIIYKGMIMTFNADNLFLKIHNIDDGLRSILPIFLVRHLLTTNSVTVTLQWPREAGVVYNVNVLPHTVLTEALNFNSSTVNLTISYNVQYNVSIVSSLCGVTTNKILNYGKYNFI